MKTATEKEMQQIESNLVSSIQFYEDMLALLQKMDTVIGTAPPSVLNELNQSFTKLQNEAMQADTVLIAQLSDTALTGSLHALDEKRRRLLEEILVINRQVTEKARGVRSFLVAEIAKFHTGLLAMNGYKPQSQHQGRIVNSAL
jgi:aspartate aminotransferase-like enzyme